MSSIKEYKNIVDFLEEQVLVIERVVEEYKEINVSKNIEAVNESIKCLKKVIN